MNKIEEEFIIPTSIPTPLPEEEDPNIIISSSPTIIIEKDKRYNNIPITITLDKVNVSLRKGESIMKSFGKIEKQPPKQILSDVTAIIRPGQLCAILGGSGSGKTTLLNTVSGRYDTSQMKVKGDVIFNDIISPPPSLIKRAVGYVMQRDYLLPNLTVRESLTYSALLRLPGSMSHAEKMARVESIIQELGLRDCANTRIGGAGKRGVSGGEKRRVSIGCQLLTDPSILFCDEPTTGLDSFTALQVTQTLVNIARQNRTVICTIHQPRHDIFKLIDQVMLLSKGQLVYIGPTSNMYSHFSSLNFKVPTLENPADYFIDICSIDYRSPILEQQSIERLSVLVTGYKQSSGYENLLVNIETKKREIESGGKKKSRQKCLGWNENDSDIKLTSQLRESTPWYRSIPVLTRRSYVNHLRDVAAAITRFSQIVSFGLMMCLCFLRLKDDQYSIQNRSGFLYETLSMIFVALLNCVALFPIERNLFYRERSDGLYSTVSFFFSYMLVEFPFNAVSSLVYSAVVYFVLGLNQQSAAHFFRFFLVTFMLLFSGESVGLFVCSLFYDVGMATTISNVLLSLFSLLAGYFRPDNQLPNVLRYINYALPTKWAGEILAVNEFSNQTFVCPGSQSLDGNGTVCPISDGTQVLTSYGWQSVDLNVSIGVMVALAVAWRFICLLTLQFNKRNIVL